VEQLRLELPLNVLDGNNDEIVRPVSAVRAMRAAAVLVALGLAPSDIRAAERV